MAIETISFSILYKIPVIFFDRPSIAKMQKVANVSITLVFILYSTSAIFGYLTFFSKYFLPTTL